MSARWLVGDMRVTLAAVSEKEWMAQVVAWARRAGWDHYHSWNSRHSPAGFPDLVLVRPRTYEILFIEVKTERGRVTHAQWKWLADLEACGERVLVWRPSDAEHIKRVLGVAP